MTVAAANVPARSALARLATERSLALGSLGLVGLHVVDDNFLQPEPGMSPVDHLPGGLTQLALVVAAAWAYPRLRAGARAALALLFGFFGVLAGIEAVYYTFADRPSGDDFTGFLSLVAGFVLLGIGIRTLWQSRRTDDSRRRRYLRRGLVFAGVVVLIPTFLMPVSIGYFATHILRAVVPTPNLGAAHEDVSFTTSDGLRLEGWFIPSRNGATVIAFPGRSGPQKHTRMLVEARLRRPPLRPAAAKAPAKAIRTSSAGSATATCTRRPTTSAAAPTSTRAGSARSGSRSAVRC